VLDTKNRGEAAPKDRSLMRSTSRRDGFATLRSVRGRLLLFAVLLAAPLILAAAGLLAWTYEREREAAEVQLRETADALALVIDRQLGQAETFLRALATSTNLAASDFRAFHAQAGEAAKTMPGWVVLEDPSGQELVDTRVSYGTPLPSVDIAEVWPDIVAGRSHVGNLLSGLAGRPPVIRISVPVVHDGRPAYVLVMVMLPAALNEVLSDQTLPEGWIATILDRAGVVVARSLSPERYVGVTASATLRDLMAMSASGGAGMTVTLEGAPVVTAWGRSPRYGWSFAVGAPSGDLVATARHTAILMVALGLLALAAGGAFAIAMARGITRPVEALASMAEKLGSGQVIADTPTGLRVTDEVLQAMRDASIALREREEALRAGEARFRTMLESLPHIAVVLRPDGTSEYHNQRFAEYFGDFPTDLADRMAVYHPEDRPRLAAARDAALAAGSAYALEARAHRPDGTYRWLAIDVRPLRRDGEIVAWLATAVDIDDIRRMNETLERRVEERSAALLASQALVQTLYNYSSECHAILVADAAGGFRYEEVNPATLRLYGMAREQVVGHTTDEVFGAAVAAEVNRNLAESLRIGGPYRYERKQRKSVIEAIAAPVPSEEGQPRRVIVSAHDVTQWRQLESQLRQAQKMEAVGQLTGGVAHDFNNLLQVILGNLDSLRRRGEEGTLRPGDRDFDRLTGNALLGAERAAVLTQRLLAFSRRQPLDPKPIDVNRLVAGMSELLRRTLGESIAMKTVLAGGLGQIAADANQLESALLNLAVNARDAMREGGQLAIETANVRLDEADAAVPSDVPAGRYAMIAVTDTGTGMADDVVARAFEPFFTTKDIGQGTGLGLSQVYGFVKQSGGHVKIYSEPGLGTTVKIYLPRLVGSSEIEAPASAEPLRPPAGTPNEIILVVEDDEDVRAHTVEMLRELGYGVLEAPHAADALRLLAERREIRLLFTDVGLPGGVNGRQLADAAARIRPDLAVLFTTGYERNAIVHHGRLDPGVELLVKPFTYAALAAKIRELLDKAQVLYKTT
jgi:PAS domain S-box-containing protein